MYFCCVVCTHYHITPTITHLPKRTALHTRALFLPLPAFTCLPSPRDPAFLPPVGVGWSACTLPTTYLPAPACLLRPSYRALPVTCLCHACLPCSTTTCLAVVPSHTARAYTHAFTTACLPSSLPACSMHAACSSCWHAASASFTPKQHVTNTTFPTCHHPAACSLSCLPATCLPACTPHLCHSNFLHSPPALLPTNIFTMHGAFVWLRFRALALAPWITMT